MGDEWRQHDLGRRADIGHADTEGAGEAGERGEQSHHQYLDGDKVRNTVEGGHRLRWKADTRMVIADT